MAAAECLGGCCFSDNGSAFLTEAPAGLAHNRIQKGNADESFSALYRVSS